MVADVSSLVVPSATEWASRLRRPTDVDLVELASCARGAPDICDELWDRAFLASLDLRHAPDALSALGLLAMRVQQALEEWPAIDVWSDEVALAQASALVGWIGVVTSPPGDIERMTERARVLQEGINESRRREGRDTLATWPRAKIILAYAVRDDWNEVIFFGRTETNWTLFVWSTGA